MTDARNIEERIAHLERQMEELSDVVAGQQTEIARLMARIEALMAREAEREFEAGGSVPLADQKPPHW